MLQYSYYATISPEGCASILWKSALKAEEAAEVMGVTAPRLLKLGLIDEIIPEPLGGAHRDKDKMAEYLKSALSKSLTPLKKLSPEQLVERRRQRLMAMGISG
jgi:acetyl-CoA carboxylase carboxyl transferase subunit alpha